jgi:hypothetical protein
MPMRAIPTVPEVVHEDPVDRETIDVIRRVASKKMEGERMDRP